MKAQKRITYLFLILWISLPVAASDQNEKTIPDYSAVERNKVPDIYKWSIQDLYMSAEDWEKDMEKAGEQIEKIDLLIGSWTETSRKMLALLDHVNDLWMKVSKLYSYASNQSDMDLGNPEYQQMKGEIRNLLISLHSKLSFMNPDILKLGKDRFQIYLDSEPGLKPYQFSVEQVLRMKDHVLPPDQQKIVSLTDLFSSSSGQAAGMLNNVEIPNPEIILSDGNRIKLNYANYTRYRASNNRHDRKTAMTAYWENHRQFENTLAILLDSGMKYDYFRARVHKYPNCLESRLYPENIDPRVYYTLVEVVRENLDSLHRYLVVKKELLGVDEYLYEDIYASATPKVDKIFTFYEARDIILKMAKPLGSEYIEGLNKAFNEGWIDIYPNKGKQSGAYSGSVYGIHPFIKMNYDGSYSSVSTLAHELGHAIHSYLSNQNQHFANSHYPTFLAEIASTFNENLLLNYLLKEEKDDLFKLFILDGYLDRVRSTLHRQTLFAEFELAMHHEVESGKTLTPEWLNKKYLELTRYYYGHEKGIVKVGDFIQDEWSGIPHFFRNYYVFQYSTGLIASMALSDKVLLESPSAWIKYLNFLKAGGSRFPLDTLKLAGVDMTSPEPLLSALKRFNKLVMEMEIIVARLRKQKRV